MPAWLFPWRFSQWHVKQDLIAGLIVAILIIPQALGYGVLAHVPPFVALASCILPLMAYALFGRSHALAIGPVAIISLMVGEALSSIPTEHVVAAAQLLSFQVALTLGVIRLFNLGNLVHFIGHPVVHGFTTAAAVVIISKQIPYMLGTTSLFDLNIHPATLLFSAIAVMTLIFSRTINWPLAGKIAPLIVVVAGIFVVIHMPQGLNTIDLNEDITGFHMSFNLPWEYFNTLLPNGILIAIIGFIESTSVAKNLAYQRKEKIHANHELNGLSFANLASAFSSGYPVAGGFGRTMVNHDAGASSPLAGVFTAFFVAIFLVFGSGVISDIPTAALGVIVTLAVWSLLDFSPLIRNWRVHPKENSIWLISFAAVLIAGAEIGILAGVITSLFFLVRSASKPHIAIIGRIPGTAHFRNIQRHNVQTSDSLLAIRIDECLHFANRDAIDDYLEDALKQHPNMKDLLIVCSAVNILDSDGIELLQLWHDKLLEQGQQLHLAEVKGPIMDDLKKRGFVEMIKPGKIFMSTDQAFNALSSNPITYR